MNRYRQYMYSYPHKTAYGPLTDLRLDDYKPRLMAPGAVNSLYFHVPFCEAKCGYCNLFSLAGQAPELVEAYLEAMARQIEQYQLAEVTFTDLTIGGGTPLYLSAAQLERLLALAAEGVHFQTAKPPIIIETSPRQTTAEKVQILKAHGVCRVSLGVQSFHDQELSALGRLHRRQDIERALALLQQADFECLNLDLIYGVPGQSEQSVLASLRLTLAYEPDEIFLYPLYVKPGTPLYRQGQRVSDEAYALYRALRQKLLEAGYTQTSMRRFVRTLAKEDVWNGCGFAEHTLAIGCGGRSYIDELHFCVPYSVRPAGCARILQAYLQKADHQVIEHGYILSPAERKRRFLLKNLLYYRGVPLKAYTALFGCSPLDDFPVLEEWRAAQWLVGDEGDYLRLTEAGLDLSDYLGPELISPEVQAKMEAWRDE